MVQTSETNSSDFWWEFFPQDCLAAIFSPWRKPVLAISPWKQFYQSNIQGYRPSWTWKDYHFSHDYPGETQRAEPDTWGLQTAGLGRDRGPLSVVTCKKHRYAGEVPPHSPGGFTALWKCIHPALFPYCIDFECLKFCFGVPDIRRHPTVGCQRGKQLCGL